MFDAIQADLFNTVEGLFWCCLGVTVLTLYTLLGRQYTKWAWFTAVVLITFGLSDFIQVVIGSFLLAGNEWLLLWKLLNVACLLGAIMWYIRLRVSNYSSSIANSMETGQ